MSRSDQLERVRAVTRHDLRILRRDPAFLIVFTVIPLAFMAFNSETFGAALTVHRGEAISGAGVVVPGAAVLFSGFLVGNVGFAIFREHGWGTWERLRSSQLSTLELMVAKSVTPILTLGFQLTVLLLGGALLFDLEITGSVGAFAAVAVALALMEVSLGFAMLSLCRSVIQLNALTNAGAMMLGGLGGAVTPVELLPGWAQAIAPAVPAYWAMRGFRSVTLEGGGFGEVVLPISVLVGFSLLFTVVAVARFRVEHTKVSWA